MSIKRSVLVGLLFFICVLFAITLFPEEGMFPLSEIKNLDLKKLGFQINSEELYNPNGISLIDGIINLNGCTASFVSPEGLILTNYHCAFKAIQEVTTTKDDYLNNGFIAKERAQEVQAKGYTVRIIESYKDVSKEVLGVLKKKMSDFQRASAIKKKQNEIEARIEKKYPGRRAEVAEMFLGKTYILFIYTYLKDVRLVYAPPRSIGEFGGEEDNWMWPRHTGDFSFLRAYTAPDGSFAEYSPENIPYHPKKYLEVAQEGVQKEDFIFILGYPGTTNRHRTSYFLDYEEKFQKPYTIQLYSWMINILENKSKIDRSVEIKLAPKLNGLWNRMKRYKGQLKGMKNLGLTAKREQAEDQLQQYINGNIQLQKKYGSLLEQLKTHYMEKCTDAEYDLLLENFLKSLSLLDNAYKIYDGSIEKRKKDTEREKDYLDKNIALTHQKMETALHNYYEPVEKIFLKEMLLRAAGLAEKGFSSIPAVDAIIKNASDTENAIDIFIDKTYSSTRLTDKSYMQQLLKKSTIELDKEDDPLLQFARALYPTFEQYREKKKEAKGLVDQLLAQLIDVKQLFVGKSFIPDANGTLRLSYGHVRGYSPADAIYYTPFTTLGGIIEKNTGQEPFIAPERLIDLFKASDFGSYIQPTLKEVPVAMLYNTDTTGGNSGSPVLNAKGQLIGLNFDRVYEATINDYAWDESYSRSIGVDIRFILWFLDKFGNAHSLLKEMNVFN